MNKYPLYPTVDTMLQLIQMYAHCNKSQCSHCPLVLKLNMEASTNRYSTIHTSTPYHLSPPYERGRPRTPRRKKHATINEIPETQASSGSLPSEPDPGDRAPTGVGSHNISKGRKGSGKRHLPRRPQCSPLPTRPRTIEPWGH